jgi:hypothetical protein
MNQARIFRIMELVWLSIAIMAAISSTWLIIKGDIDAARFPLFVAFCAAILFALRRYQRKRIEKVEAFEKENPKAASPKK